MALTGKLGTSDSRLGNIQLGNAGGAALPTVTARGGVIVSGRAVVTVIKPLAARGSVIVGGRATLTVSPDEVNPAARGGVIVGGRATLTPTRTPDARGGIVVGGRATITRVTDGLLTPRGGVIVGGRATITVTRIVKARGGVIVGGAVAKPQVTRTVKARGGVIVGGRDAYVGPGTGIVVQGFVDPLSVLREGDTFNVFLPWAGLSGMSGLAHVLSRSVSDEREDQQIELSIVPHDDTSRIPAQAGGATPTPQADSTDLARQVSAQQRSTDRIERNR